ncbi:MAG: efflux RND transporter permease subunit [Thermoanaerobaculia bacterium]|nr:efflux RND transporter permease subunit [Thermoanaerobaculia bacterium]
MTETEPDSGSDSAVGSAREPGIRPVESRRERSALVELAISRPVTVFIGAVAAIVFGWVAFRQLATDLLPDVTYPSLTIRTELPGAAPVEVETLITRPVEDAVGVVGNLVRVESSSRPEISEVTLEFAWGTSMDFAALDVRERLDVVRLPQDSDPPVLLRYDPSLDPILRLAVASDGEDPTDDLVRLRLVAEERVKRPLERLEGVAAVEVQGGLEEEIQVEVDERALANYGLSVELLSQRLTQENVDITGGELRDGQSRFLVRTVGEMFHTEELGRIVLRRIEPRNTGGTSPSEAAVVRLEDVASIRRGSEEREIVTRLDGREAVEVGIYKAGGTNTVTVSKAVHDRLDQVRAELRELNPDLRIEVVSDQARYIESAVREVLETAAYGGLLAVLVLFLFLRSWKATAIIGAAIPISVVATFFLMYVGDISLNIMSLGGLTLGIGLLVDNAIVVLESMAKRREEGLDDDDAARDGASKVARAIAASTFTSICVFLPIIFVEGVAAQFFADQALTVTFSLLVSLLVALTVIPMLASRRAPGVEEVGGSGQSASSEPASVRWTVASLTVLGRVLGMLWIPIAWLLDRPAVLFQRVFDRVAKAYGQLLRASLHRPYIVVLIAALVFGASLFLYRDLGRELVPELVQGEFFADVQLEPGTHLEVTQRRLAGLEKRALALDGVAHVYSVAGASREQGGQAGENREHRGQITLTVAEPFSRQKEEDLLSQMREIVADDSQLEARFGRPSYFSFQKPIEIELRGFHLKLLRRLSDELVTALETAPGITDVESTAEGGAPELQVRFDRDRLSAYGLTLQQVAQVLRTKVEGDIASEIQRQDRTIGIRVRTEERFRNSARSLRQLVVHQQDGIAIPLMQVAEVTEAEGPAEIRRVDGERAALITANLEGVDLASAERTIREAVESLGLPTGFDWRLGGQQREMEQSFDSMKLALSLAVFLVYLVMASQFESLLHPLVILGSVPLSLVGVLGTLWLFDIRLSVVVLIGVVLLAGIVVNNAILLVDTANRLRREGLARFEAIHTAGTLRLRPILMTTATTCLGLLPMAIGLGEGAELRAPMAMTVIGGLLVSTLLTLVVIPSVYRILER